MASERLRKIIQSNREFERKSPYNFCDRWCERCDPQRQARCRIYQDDLERKMTCIAHGKDEDDPQMTQAIMEAQYGDIAGKLAEMAEEWGIDLDEFNESASAEAISSPWEKRKDDMVVNHYFLLIEIFSSND